MSEFGTIRSDASGGLHIELNPKLRYSERDGWTDVSEPDPEAPETKEYIRELLNIMNMCAKRNP